MAIGIVPCKFTSVDPEHFADPQLPFQLAFDLFMGPIRIPGARGNRAASG